MEFDPPEREDLVEVSRTHMASIVHHHITPDDIVSCLAASKTTAMDMGKLRDVRKKCL